MELYDYSLLLKTIKTINTNNVLLDALKDECQHIGYFNYAIAANY